MLWVGVHRRQSCVVIFSSIILDQSNPNLVCNICRVRGGGRNDKYHDLPPKGEVIWGKKCKIAVILNKSSSLLQRTDHTNEVCSNEDHGRVYQNSKCYDPLCRGSCARAWPYKSYSENALFLLKIFFSTLPGLDQTNLVYNIDDQGRVY